MNEQKRKLFPCEVRRKQRYRDDPAMRKRHSKAARASYLRLMENPRFRELHHVRNKIFRARKAIASLLKRTIQKERALVKFVLRREELERRLKQEGVKIRTSAASLDSLTLSAHA